MALSSRGSIYTSCGTLTLALSTAISDRGSTFIAVCAYPCKTTKQAQAAIMKLREHSSIVSASARVSAYRSSDGNEDKDDDGEARAGQQLLIALRKMKIKGVAMVVGRWWHGNIGKARFTHIRERATSLLLACGASKNMDMSQLTWVGLTKGKCLKSESSCSNASSITSSSSSSSLTTSNKSNAKRRRDLYAAAAEERQNNKRRHIEPSVVVSKQKDNKTQLSTTQLLTGNKKNKKNSEIIIISSDDEEEDLLTL